MAFVFITGIAALTFFNGGSSTAMLRIDRPTCTIGWRQQNISLETYIQEREQDVQIRSLGYMGGYVLEGTTEKSARSLYVQNDAGSYYGMLGKKINLISLEDVQCPDEVYWFATYRMHRSKWNGFAIFRPDEQTLRIDDSIQIFPIN